jgi:hypothetical protein
MHTSKPDEHCSIKLSPNSYHWLLLLLLLLLLTVVPCS